jgi:hypothetical protein
VERRFANKNVPQMCSLRQRSHIVKVSLRFAKYKRRVFRLKYELELKATVLRDTIDTYTSCVAPLLILNPGEFVCHALFAQAVKLLFLWLNLTFAQLCFAKLKPCSFYTYGIQVKSAGKTPLCCSCNTGSDADGHLVSQMYKYMRVWVGCEQMEWAVKLI